VYPSAANSRAAFSEAFQVGLAQKTTISAPLSGKTSEAIVAT
jgi:hypothetical protein